MMKETNKISVKSVFQETVKSNYGFSTHLLIFALLTISSLVLAYLLPYSLIVTIPIVIIPSYFAFTSLNSIKGKKNSEGVGFFSMYRMYFSSIFFGGYRLLIGLLKTFLAYLISNTVIITIYDLTVFSKSEEFKVFVEAFNNADSSSLMEIVDSFTDSLLTNSALQKWLYLSLAISFVIAAFVFIHHVAKHSLKMKRNLFTKQIIPTRQFNFVDRRVRRDNRKFLLLTYTRTCWFIQLLLVLVASGGVVGSFFLLKDFTPERALVICLFLMFVVSLPFMNYVSKLQDMIFFTLGRKYEETFATLTLEFLTKYKEKIGLAEEEAKKIEEILTAQKEANKDQVEEEKKDSEDK